MNAAAVRSQTEFSLSTETEYEWNKANEKKNKCKIINPHTVK